MGRKVAQCFPQQPERKRAHLNDIEEIKMGRGILLWLLGVPLPIILLLAMCSHN